MSKLRSKLAWAEVVVAKTSDFGVNDKQYTTVTHLGHLLNPGDTAAGYDVLNANIPEEALAMLKGRQLPDVILVRKTYPSRKNRQAKRVFKLKELRKEAADNVKKGDAERAAQDYEDFMQELEEDPELRKNVNLYRREDANRGAARAADEKEDMDDDGDEDGFPEVALDELLTDLKLEDGDVDDETPIEFNR